MKLKKLLKATTMLIVSILLSLLLQTIAPAFTTPLMTAQAATTKTVKLNTTKKTLTVGDTYKLKVSGTTAKVKWWSNKKSVATVSKWGTVTAKAVGTATITAKVNNKKYTCKITVKAASKYVTDAPFDAKEVKIGVYSGVIPKDWECNTMEFNGTTVYAIYPTLFGNGTSNITMTSVETGAQQKNIDLYKSALQMKLSEESILAQLTSTLGDGIQLKDYKTARVEIASVQYETISYSIVLTNGTIIKQMAYYLFADGYTSEFVITEGLTETTPLIRDVMDYFLNTLTFTK